MMFLNDVESGGEVLFPLADNETFTWEVSIIQLIINHKMIGLKLWKDVLFQKYGY